MESANARFKSTDIDSITPIPIITFLNAKSIIQDEKLTFKLDETISKKNPTLTASTPYMTYSAKPSKQEFTKFYVGVKKESSNEIYLHPANLFEMLPDVLKPNETENSPDIDSKMMSSSNDISSHREQHKELIKAFGSKFAKRRVATAERSKDDSSILANTIETTIQCQPNISDEETLNSFMQVSFILPPHDSTTDVVSDVYTLEQLFSESEIASVSLYAKQMRKVQPSELQEWYEESRFKPYILSWLNKNGHEQLKEHSKYQTSTLYRVLACLHFLIGFYELPVRKNYKKETIESKLDYFPDAIRNKCLAEFSEINEYNQNYIYYVLNKRLKDKLLLYIITLALIIENYSMDPTLLMNDLQITHSNAKIYFQALGCNISSLTNSRKRKLNEEFVDEDNAAKPNIRLTAPLKIPIKISKSSSHKTF